MVWCLFHRKTRNTMIAIVFFVVSVASLTGFYAKAANASCVGTACGNKQLQGITSGKTVTFLVYSVWVGKPLEDLLLNHQYYCNVNGYEYRHFYRNRTSFDSLVAPMPLKAGVTPGAWLSVYVARELLKTSKADYFFKLDLDCVFIRTDVRLESLIDPLQRYSLYTTNTDPPKRFMQTQSWILKRTTFSKLFVKEWLEYVHRGSCGDLAYEQGAFHLTVGAYFSALLGKKGTPYTCPLACDTHRSAYKHHHCVLDWLEDNGFGMSGSMNTQPHIYVYPYPNTTSYNSPDDGFVLELNNAGLQSNRSPLTVHPLKKHIYATPEDVNAFVRETLR